MISIVICVYNGENVIRRAISSVLKQAFNDFELIIVDDGSTDRTLEICNNYAKLDNRIRIIHQQNCGLGFARRVGLDSAKGDWIAYLDADDWFEANWIKDLFQETLKEELVDIVIGNAYMCYDMGDGGIRKQERVSMSKHYVFHEEEKEFLVANAIAARMNSNSGVAVEGKRSIGTVWDKLYRVDFLRENRLNFKNTYFGEDLPFTSMCFTLANKVVYTETIGYNYYIWENSLSNRHDYQYVLNNQEIVSFYLENLNLKSDIIRRAIAVSQIRFLMIDIERYFDFIKDRERSLIELERLLGSEDFLRAITFGDADLEDMNDIEKHLFMLIKGKKYDEILNVPSWYY